MAQIVAQSQRPKADDDKKDYFFKSTFNTQADAMAWKDEVLTNTWLEDWWFDWQIVRIANDSYVVKVYYQRHEGALGCG